MMLSGHPSTQSLSGSEKSCFLGTPHTQALGGAKRAWVRLCFLGTLVPSLWGLEKRAWVRWCFLGTLRTSWWNYGELSFLALGITTKSISTVEAQGQLHHKVVPVVLCANLDTPPFPQNKDKAPLRSSTSPGRSRLPRRASTPSVSPPHRFLMICPKTFRVTSRMATGKTRCVPK